MGRNPYLDRFSAESAADLRIAMENMKKTGVDHLAERVITEISGGERQRVLIARALTQTPRVLLLDEPTVHLDICSQIEIMDLLRSLSRRDGLTIVSVHHDFNLAARYCDRLLLMGKGKIEAAGTPEEVLTRGNIRRVFGIDVHIGRSHLTDSVYAVPLVDHKPRGLRRNRTVHLICGGGSGAALMRRLVEDGWETTAGVLNILDTDYEVAASLGIPVAHEAPFSPITEAAYQSNLRLIQNADIVIVTDFLVGPGNMVNLGAAEAALESGIPTILVGVDTIGERDYTGGAAAALAQKLIDMGGKVAGSLDEAIRQIESLQINPLRRGTPH
jgi:iron complex transport system ATP-binding protein